MSNRSAESGKFITPIRAKEFPGTTVKESATETKSVMRLTAKRRPSQAEKLIIKMLRKLETHPAYEGFSAQQILDEVNRSK